MNYYYIKEDRKKRQLETALSALLIRLFKYNTDVLSLRSSYIESLIYYYERIERYILTQELKKNKDLIHNITELNNPSWIRLAVIKTDLILNTLHDKQKKSDDQRDFRQYYNTHITEFVSPTEINNAAQKTKQSLLYYVMINGVSTTASKMWITRGDDRVRIAHQTAAFETVPWYSTFSVGGEKLRYPGDELGSPGNVINCRCSMLISY